MKEYLLKLYITGNTSVSLQALDNVKRFCNEYLRGRYQLEVIDVLRDPSAIEKDEVFSTPTFVRVWPLPVRKIIGDLSDYEQLLSCLLSVDPNAL